MHSPLFLTLAKSKVSTKAQSCEKELTIWGVKKAYRKGFSKEEARDVNCN